MMQNMNTHPPQPISHADSSRARRAREESAENLNPPNPEVATDPPRRAFTAQYKLSIVEQADACQRPGEVGALLRREGLYSSHLTNWRRLKRQGALQSLGTQPRGPKPSDSTSNTKTISSLERKVARLEKELEKAHTIIDVQKKLSVLLSNEPEQENT